MAAFEKRENEWNLDIGWRFHDRTIDIAKKKKLCEASTAAMANGKTKWIGKCKWQRAGTYNEPEASNICPATDSILA